jgi:hypothetical protein
MYLMSKQVESGSEVHLGSARMLIDALNFLAVQVFGKGLEPGACVCVRCAENRARKIRLRYIREYIRIRVSFRG